MPKFITVLDGTEEFFENGYGRLKSAVGSGIQKGRQIVGEVSRNMGDAQMRQAEAERQAVQEIVRAVTPRPQPRPAPAVPQDRGSEGRKSWRESLARGYHDRWESEIEGKPPERKVPKGEHRGAYSLGQSLGGALYGWDEELSKGPDGFRPSQPSAPISGGGGSAAGPSSRKRK